MFRYDCFHRQCKRLFSITLSGEWPHEYRGCYTFSQVLQQSYSLAHESNTKHICNSFATIVISSLQESGGILFMLNPAFNLGIPNNSSLYINKELILMSAILMNISCRSVCDYYDMLLIEFHLTKVYTSLEVRETMLLYKDVWMHMNFNAQSRKQNAYHKSQHLHN